MVENVIGKTYGLLTVLAEAERVRGSRKVFVRCSCEAATEKEVELKNLRSGHTTGCGCVRREATRSRSTTHGFRHHTLYNNWCNMLQRCQNPNYKGYSDYGGRGITVCERWQKFENFYADMQSTHQDGLTLDRKDNNQGYSLDNCRWATRAEQNRNTRRNINVTLNGKTQCLASWCKELNLNYRTVLSRIYKGKTPEQALSYPV